MNHWKKQICTAAFALALAVQLLPGQAAAATADEAAKPGQSTEATKPVFQNPQGMTVDLVYYYLDEDGNEKIAGMAERNVIPAGTTVISLELQKHLLPEGYSLKDPKEIPLEEGTQEVKILVTVNMDSEAKPQEPTQPEDMPTEPDAKPTEPSEKPTEPADKPTEPSEKPTEPAEKPTEPTVKPTEPKPEKPGKPQQKPDKKPDNSNPKTEDPFALGMWLTLGLGSAAALLAIGKKKYS